MPPVSEQQRKLMWAARTDPKVRKKTGIGLKTAKKFTDADPGGKLPPKIKATAKLMER